MKAYLAADIGGTKTLFQLLTEQGELVLEQELVSKDFSNFDLILKQFLQQEAVNNYSLESACFAVAGPVTEREAYVTNLPWQLNADSLASDFNISHVHLCNDFEAVAYGISCLADDEIITLQQGEWIADAPRAVIGAGTGLGQALLFPEDDAWRVVATEGGHINFAPTNSMQISLLENLIERFGQVSYECIVSGGGIVALYEFLRAYKQVDENPELKQAMIDNDPAAAISQFATDKRCNLAVQTMELFVEIYGCQAGNLALNVIPRAGLYLAGGIVSKNLKFFQNGNFIKAFNSKGKMQTLVEKIPVYIILQTKVGLLGAQLLAQRA